MRYTKGVLAIRRAGGPTGHPGVAAWVAANSADVLAYYPTSDAAASSTMGDESGNSRDGTYQSGITAGDIDGFTVVETDNVGTATDYATVADAAWMDSIVGIFAVIDLDGFASVPALASRDGASQRQWQWRVTTTGQLQFLQITTGNPSIQTANGTITGNTTGGPYRHTVGVYISGGSYKLYIDGVSMTVTGGTPIFETGTQDLDLGRIAFGTNGGQYIDGEWGSFVFLSAADDASFSELHTAWVGA